MGMGLDGFVVVVLEGEVTGGTTRRVSGMGGIRLMAVTGVVALVVVVVGGISSYAYPVAYTASKANAAPTYDSAVRPPKKRGKYHASGCAGMAFIPIHIQ